MPSTSLNRLLFGVVGLVLSSCSCGSGGDAKTGFCTTEQYEEVVSAQDAEAWESVAAEYTPTEAERKQVALFWLFVMAVEHDRVDAQTAAFVHAEVLPGVLGLAERYPSMFDQCGLSQATAKGLASAKRTDGYTCEQGCSLDTEAFSGVIAGKLSSMGMGAVLGRLGKDNVLGEAAELEGQLSDLADWGSAWYEGTKTASEILDEYDGEKAEDVLLAMTDILGSALGAAALVSSAPAWGTAAVVVGTVAFAWKAYDAYDDTLTAVDECLAWVDENCLGDSVDQGWGFMVDGSNDACHFQASASATPWATSCPGCSSYGIERWWAYSLDFEVDAAFTSTSGCVRDREVRDSGGTRLEYSGFDEAVVEFAGNWAYQERRFDHWILVYSSREADYVLFVGADGASGDLFPGFRDTEAFYNSRDGYHELDVPRPGGDFEGLYFHDPHETTEDNYILVWGQVDLANPHGGTARE